jgi:hypothetical protein
MKIFKSVVFGFSLFSLSSVTAFASETVKLDWSGDSAYTFLYDSEWNSLQARVRFTHSGNKKIITFLLTPKNESEECRLGLPFDSRVKEVFEVNGQALKGALWCQSYTDTGNRYYRFSTLTEAGGDYLVKTFMNSKEVIINHPLGVFTVSAIGFSNVWNSKSDSAL